MEERVFPHSFYVKLSWDLNCPEYKSRLPYILVSIWLINARCYARARVCREASKDHVPPGHLPIVPECLDLFGF